MIPMRDHHASSLVRPLLQNLHPHLRQTVVDDDGTVDVRVLTQCQVDFRLLVVVVVVEVVLVVVDIS